MGGLGWSDHSGVERRIKPWGEEKAESRQGFLSDGRAVEVFREMKSTWKTALREWLLCGFSM